MRRVKKKRGLSEKKNFFSSARKSDSKIEIQKYRDERESLVEREGEKKKNEGERERERELGGGRGYVV